jgi:hypothetical protein
LRWRLLLEDPTAVRILAVIDVHQEEPRRRPPPGRPVLHPGSSNSKSRPLKILDRPVKFPRLPGESRRRGPGSDAPLPLSDVHVEPAPHQFVASGCLKETRSVSSRCRLVIHVFPRRTDSCGPLKSRALQDVVREEYGRRFGIAGHQVNTDIRFVWLVAAPAPASSVRLI